MEELLQQISDELKDIKSNMVTRQELEETAKETKEALIEELKRVADTLETIAVGETSATKEKLEDKMEAGDVLLKSLFDGLKKEMAEIKTEMKSEFHTVIKTLETIANFHHTSSRCLA